MGKTRVVHVSDNIEGAVYIGRAVPRKGIRMSRWANPYRVGPNRGLLQGRVLTRAEAVEMYREAITTGPLAHLIDHLDELRGKPLACWCRRDGAEKTPDTLCHGDVLVDLIEAKERKPVKSTCEALRRDGTPCPHAWKHAQLTTVVYSGDGPDRHVYLCGSHRNSLRKGVMSIPLGPADGRYRHVYERRDGTIGWSESEVIDGGN